MERNKWFLYGFVVCLTAVTAIVAGVQAAPSADDASAAKTETSQVAPDASVSAAAVPAVSSVPASQPEVAAVPEVVSPEAASMPAAEVSPAATPVLAQAPVSPVVSVTKDEPRISLEFKQPTDIRMVLRAIAQKAKINIVPSPEVLGEITIVLKDVTWRKAVEVISTTYGYGYEDIGDGVVRVAQNIQPPLEIKSYPLKFATAQVVADNIRPLLSPRGMMTVDARTNTIIIRDVANNHLQLAGLIAQLDIITSQVTIEAKIIEADQQVVDQLGLDWTRTALPGAVIDGAARFTNPPIATSSNEVGLFTFSAINTRKFSMVLTALLRDSKTNILSEPNITTVDNNPATIKVTDKIPIPNYAFNADTGSWEISGYNEKEYGITLKVTPQISAENEKKERFITLMVEPTVSEKKEEGSLTFSGNVSGEIPAASEQTTSTKVIVKDGQTLVIAGLIKNKELNTVSKLPLLGDIPYVGKAFQHRDKETTKVNLLIFITPKIVNTDAVPDSTKEFVEDNRSQLSNEFVAMSLDKELDSYLADVDKKIETGKTAK